MDSHRQEYIAVLASLDPEEAVNVLNNRVALIHQINTSIADFLEERRRIEEQYAANLRKLARRPQQEADATLGIFQMPWQRILSGTENLAQSHETLASKIQADVELPLRQYRSTSRETEAITTTQGNLASLAKDVSKAKDKVDKLTAKGSKKASDANSEVEEAIRAWESQSPSIFSQLQALDESRLEHLRGVLTQFQTHEADQVERNRASAESCLNALLNVETADEIKTFAVKVQQGRSSTVRRPSTAVGEPRPSSSSNVPPTPPPPRSKASTSGDKLGALPEPTPHKSKMGGLKRLGTVMRRKSAAPPPPTPLTEKKKEKRSIFRRGDSSRSFQDLEETGRDLTPVATQQEHGSSVADATATEADSRPATSTLPIPSNGLTAPLRSPTDELPQPLMPTSAQSLQPTASPIEQSSVPTGHDPFAVSDVTSNTAADSEDASRNLKIRDQPIPEDADAAQLAMSSMANRLRLQAQTSGLNRSVGSVRGRRDVRNTMFIPGNQDVAGLANSSPNAGLSPPSTSANFVTPSVVSQPSPLLTSPDLSAGARRTIPPGTSVDDHATISDANSIHSAHSLAAVPYHPELHEPGLNASIVETVNTWFSDSGVTKSFVVGEIAFSHITSPTATPLDTETVRLQNFQILEKVAANPTFVTPYRSASTAAVSAEESAGSYTVSLSAIRRTTPTIGLKYQLHLNESDLARYSPLLITPAWQIVAGQASAIVLYSLNPSFVLSSGGGAPSEVTLRNVVISVNLNVKDASAGKPATAAMMPTQGASFRRKAGAVVWRFPELKATSQQERLLVRFQIENDGVAQKSGVEVKFELPDVTAGNLGVETLKNVSTRNEPDPFADSSPQSAGTAGWTTIPTRRLLVSGRYGAV